MNNNMERYYLKGLGSGDGEQLLGHDYLEANGWILDEDIFDFYTDDEDVVTFTGKILPNVHHIVNNCPIEELLEDLAESLVNTCYICNNDEFNDTVGVKLKEIVQEQLPLLTSYKKKKVTEALMSGICIDVIKYMIRKLKKAQGHV